MIKFPLHFERTGSALVLFFLIAIPIGFQNCGGSGLPSRQEALDGTSAQSNPSTEGGNGEGYDGKLYFEAAHCKASSKIASTLPSSFQLSDPQKDLLNRSRSVLLWYEQLEKAILFKENCMDLANEKEIEVARTSISNDHPAHLLIEAKVFVRLDHVIPKNVTHIKLSGNLKNVDLGIEASKVPYKGNIPTVVEITPGSVIYSDRLDTPPLQFGALANAGDLVIINHGSILGTGHDRKLNETPNKGHRGQDAIEVQGPATIVNYGKIIGGRGTAGDHDCDSCCTGSDGPSAGGDGGSGIVLEQDAELINYGLIAGGGGAGAGGGGAFGAGVCAGFGGNGAGGFVADLLENEAGGSGASSGGAGGVLGMAGARGGNAGNGWADGGQGGFAIEIKGRRIFMNGRKVDSNMEYNNWLSGTLGRIRP